MEQVRKLKTNQASNGAAVVMDPVTGEIKALVGSKDWFDNSFGKVNMALKVGIADAINSAKNLGLTTLKDPSNYGLSLVLGVADVKLLELTLVIPHL